MTRKNKKLKHNASSEDLELALNDPNCIVTYNKDGSYNIETFEHLSMSLKDNALENDQNNLYNVYTEIKNYSENLALPLLDKCDFSKFCHHLFDQSK